MQHIDAVANPLSRGESEEIPDKADTMAAAVEDGEILLGGQKDDIGIDILRRRVTCLSPDGVADRRRLLMNESRELAFVIEIRRVEGKINQTVFPGELFSGCLDRIAIDTPVNHIMRPAPPLRAGIDVDTAQIDLLLNGFIARLGVFERVVAGAHEGKHGERFGRFEDPAARCLHRPSRPERYRGSHI